MDPPSMPSLSHPHMQPHLPSLDARCPSCGAALRLHVGELGQSMQCGACDAATVELVGESLLERVAVLLERWDLAPQELLPVTLPCDRPPTTDAAGAGAGAGSAAPPLTGLAVHTFTSAELAADPLASAHFVTAFDCYEGAVVCQQLSGASTLPPDVLQMLRALDEPSIEAAVGEVDQAHRDTTNDAGTAQANGAANAAAPVVIKAEPADEAEEEAQIRREERRIARHSLQRNLSAILAQQSAATSTGTGVAPMVAAGASTTSAAAADSSSPFGRTASRVHSHSQGSAPFSTVKEETLSDMEVASDVSRAASAAAAAATTTATSRVASRQTSTAGPAPTAAVGIAEEATSASPGAVAGEATGTATVLDDASGDAERTAADLSAFVGLEALDALPSLSQSLSQSQPQSQPDLATDMGGLREAAAAYVTQSQLGVATEAPHSVVSRAFSLTSAYLAADLSGIGGHSMSGGDMALGMGLGPSRTVSGFNFAQTGPSRTTSELIDGAPFLGLDGMGGGGGAAGGSMGPTRQPSLFQVPPPPPLPFSSAGDSQMQMSPQPSMSFGGSLPLMSPQSQSALGGYQLQRMPSAFASGMSSSGSVVGAHLPPGRSGSFARIGNSRVSGLLSRGVLPRASFATAYNQQMQMQAQAHSGTMQQQQQQQSDFDSHSNSGEFMLQSPMSPPQDHSHMFFGGGGNGAVPSTSSHGLTLSSRLPSMGFGSQGAQMVPLGSPTGGGDMHMEGLDAPMPLVGAGLLARKESNEFGTAQGFGHYMAAAHGGGSGSGSQQELQQYQSTLLGSPLASPSHSLAQTQAQAAAAYPYALPPPPPPMPRQLDSQLMLRLSQGDRQVAGVMRQALAAAAGANAGAAGAMDPVHAALAEQRAISRVMALLGVSSALRDHLQDYCARLGTDRETARLAGHIAREMQVHKLSATRESNSICAAALYLAYKLQGKNPTQGPFCKTLGRTEVTVRKIYKGDMARRWFDLVPDDYEPLHIPPDFAPRPPRPLLSATAGRARRGPLPMRSASSTLHALHGDTRQAFMDGIDAPQTGQSPPPTAATGGSGPGASGVATSRVASWSRRVSAVPMPSRPLPPGVVAVVGALRRSSGAPLQGQLRFRVAQPYALDGVRRLAVRLKPTLTPPAGTGPASAAMASTGAGAGAPPPSSTPRARRTNLPGSAREANSDSDTEEDEETITRRTRGEQRDAGVADVKAQEQSQARAHHPPLKRARTLLGATPDLPVQFQRPPRAHIIGSQQQLIALIQQQQQRQLQR